VDIFDETILEFWRACHKAGLRYIMVGGFATNIHGFSRVTDDMDIYMDDTPENRRALRIAFRYAEIGDFEPLERMQFVPGWTYFHLNNGLRLDIMTEMKGLENTTFKECYDLATEAEIHGTPVRFLHLNHLIENKKVVNRPKDQVDVMYLEKIKQLLEKKNDR
jgi:hypothetical protein